VYNEKLSFSSVSLGTSAPLMLELLRVHESNIYLFALGMARADELINCD